MPKKKEVAEENKKSKQQRYKTSLKALNIRYFVDVLKRENEPAICHSYIRLLRKEVGA
jgi:hypothetical protein